MALDLYDLATLLEVSRSQRDPAPAFWLGYYPRQINFDTPEIMFDKVRIDNRGMAPFVMPHVQGRPQRRSGYSTDRFAPAYVKIKDVVDPSMHIDRLPGETPIVGGYSLEARRNAVIAELIAMAKQKFDNTEEWMAAQGLINASIVIAGEDYPTTTVSFNRDASLTQTLLTTARWTEAGTANPMADLKAKRLAVNVLSGQKIRRYVFGTTAWDLFAQRVNLRDMMDHTKGGYDTKVTLLSDGYEGAEYMGTISGAEGQGAMECWVYSGKLKHPDTGVEFDVLDPTYVVGLGNPDGVRCYGAIMDAEAGYRPLTRFFKNWRNPDPSVEYLLHQSAPLMVPKNPNGTFRIKVAD